MQIITAAITKGGTGKTTTLAALAQAATQSGQRVLAVDLDPQANLTVILGANPNRPGSYEALNGEPAPQLIQETQQGIDTLSGSAKLATMETARGSATRLQRALEPIRAGYDLIVIDVPPTMGEMQYNALQAATGLIIPLEADTNSLQGLYQICDIARQFQRGSNPGLSIIGSVITRFDSRPNINKYLKQVIADKGKEAGAGLLAAIRPGIAVREAQALQQSLFEYAPKSKPAADYMNLYKLIMEE